MVLFACCLEGRISTNIRAECEAEISISDFVLFVIFEVQDVRICYVGMGRARIRSVAGGGSVGGAQSLQVTGLMTEIIPMRDLLGIVVQPLDLHLVNEGSIPTGPTHGEGRLQPHPRDVLKSTPNVRKSP